MSAKVRRAIDVLAKVIHETSYGERREILGLVASCLDRARDLRALGNGLFSFGKKEGKVKNPKTRNETYWADASVLLLADVRREMWRSEYGLELDEGRVLRPIVRLLWLEAERNRLGLRK